MRVALHFIEDNLPAGEEGIYAVVNNAGVRKNNKKCRGENKNNAGVRIKNRGKNKKCRGENKN